MRTPHSTSSWAGVLRFCCCVYVYTYMYIHVSSTQNFQLRHWQTLCSCSGFGPSWVLLYHLKPCDAKQRSSLTTTESTERTFCGPRCEQTNASAHERASEVAGVPIQRSRDSSKNSHGSLPPPWRREGRLISLSRGSKDWTLDSFDSIGNIKMPRVHAN